MQVCERGKFSVVCEKIPVIVVASSCICVGIYYIFTFPKHQQMITQHSDVNSRFIVC